MNAFDMLRNLGDSSLDEAALVTLNDSLVGLERMLGVRYTYVDKQSVRAQLAVGEHHLQPAGLVNGGVMASLGESLAGVAGIVAAGAAVVGVNNSTDFIGAVSAGVIEAEATPVQVGRRTQIWQVDLTHRDRLVARSTVRNMVVGEQ